MTWKTGFYTTLFILGANFSNAQGIVNQEAVAPLLESQGSSYDAPQLVTWHRYDISKSGKNSKAVIAKLQTHIDSLPGVQWGQRMAIVELSNRVTRKYFMQRATLLIPDSFPQDFRAYTPYPMVYAGAATLPKLFIVDKYTQTFAAYEAGKLVRWGLARTGHDDYLTPAGRYAFNWKEEYRESTAAPEGEVWKLRWVFNFNAKEGIHVHQYTLPIATPSSHGCVRLTESDAQWNFNWADGWKMQGGKLKESGTPVLILNYNPAGLAAHWSGPGQSLVMLPEDPISVPFGSNTKETVAKQ